MTTMTAIVQNVDAESSASSGASRIARVEVLREIAAAEAIWRALERPEHLSTPFQRFDLLAAWQRHVGSHKGLAPFIVVVRDAEANPLALLPLAVERRHGVRVARFLGGKHTTFNMPLWRRDFAPCAGQADLAALLAGLRGQPEPIDVLALTQQPARWRDIANPMALLPHQPSVNGCPLLALTPGAPPTDRISNSFRRRLRGKEKKLQALPGFGSRIAASEAEIVRLLDWFFVVKPQRMAAQNLPNVFADPGVESFIRDACLAPGPDGGHAIDIHALSCDEEPIALFAGVADGRRFSMMFNTYTLSENARHSPGLILMRDIIDHYAEKGYSALDLGIGTDEYKRIFCKDDEPIVDSFVPLSARGRIAAPAMASLARAKRAVKQNPALMNLAQQARSALQR
uniref:BioF2-like acetyltransferase domain-containing protein n=1 Tax=Rhodopseudomonas palustris (strain BisA53) TaxID=316055 RepID=Q07MQ1_RHOP5